MFRSCFQRPKNVIFEGLLSRFGNGVGEERKKKMEKKKRKRALEGENVRERI